MSESRRGLKRMNQRRSSRQWMAFATIALLFAGCSFKSCVGLGNWEAVTENALDDAIYALNNTSADWQQIVRELQDELPAEVQSTIRVEVANVVSRSIAQAGVEFRCDVTFIRDQVEQALEKIRGEFLGRTVPPVEPALCHVFPPAVVRAQVPERLPQVEFYGYDFDQASDLRVFHERTSGRRSEVTDELDRPTHYAMTLKFGPTGVRLDDRSERLTLEWGGETISTIAIVQPETPICGQRKVEIPPTPVSLVPQHTRGDRDFASHGPTVDTTVTLVQTMSSISARVHMRAYESNPDNSPRSDHTTVDGTETFPLYTAPSGWRIDRLLGSPSTSHRYRDSDHARDRFGMGSGGPVQRFYYVGDTRGNEAGDDTRVDVKFNRIAVEIVEADNCVTERSVTTLRNRGMIRDATFRALEGTDGDGR